MSAKSLTRRALALATPTRRPNLVAPAQVAPLPPKGALVTTPVGVGTVTDRSTAAGEVLVKLDSGTEFDRSHGQWFAADSVVVAPGHDDSVIIFRSWLLRTQGDGVELRAALDRMTARAPKIAAQVIFAGSLGEISQGRAAASLRTYLGTGVAQAPLGL